MHCFKAELLILYNAVETRLERREMQWKRPSCE